MWGRVSDPSRPSAARQRSASAPAGCRRALCPPQPELRSNGRPRPSKILAPLALVAYGKYAESWQEAAQLFNAAVSKEQWQSATRASRELLGKVLSRKLKRATYTKTLLGAPDGEYVVIQSDSSFEHKQSAVKTVTPMLDKGGKWRVSGYFIKQCKDAPSVRIPPVSPEPWTCAPNHGTSGQTPHLCGALWTAVDRRLLSECTGHVPFFAPI